MDNVQPTSATMATLTAPGNHERDGCVPLACARAEGASACTTAVRAGDLTPHAASLPALSPRSYVSATYNSGDWIKSSNYGFECGCVVEGGRSGCVCAALAACAACVFSLPSLGPAPNLALPAPLPPPPHIQHPLRDLLPDAQLHPRGALVFPGLWCVGN